MISTTAWLLIIASVSHCAGRETTGCSDSGKLPVEADGYHWTPSVNPLKEVYSEWWFFTLIDSTNNFGMVFSYAVDDPGNFLGHAASGVSAMIYPEIDGAPLNCTTVDMQYPLPFGDFAATAANATVAVGRTNRIDVVDASTYKVSGASLDGVTSWNLTFTQLADGMEQEVQAPEVFQLDWASYMPAARVDGTVQYAGRQLDVSNALGYHDHNWGFWPTRLFDWVWASFSGVSATTGLRYTSVIGAYKIPLVTNDTYIGYVIIRYGDQHIKLGTLCGNSFQMVPQTFVPWPGYSPHKLCVANAVEAENDEYRVTYLYKTKTWSTNPSGFHMGLLVSEQISDYSVNLYKKNGTEWVLHDSFNGRGFNEWCNSIL